MLIIQTADRVIVYMYESFGVFVSEIARPMSGNQVRAELSIMRVERDDGVGLISKLPACPLMCKTWPALVNAPLGPSQFFPGRTARKRSSTVRQSGMGRISSGCSGRQHRETLQSRHRVILITCS